MDGFGPALSGHHDVADTLSRYLQSRAVERLAAGHAEKRSIDSRTAFESRRERVREAFLDGIGGLPAPPTGPEVDRGERTAFEGYAVERLAIESLSDVHVAANCYVPEGEGPHPGVLFCCGHAEPAKADPENQLACAELARNGFVVLIFDPVGQGERTQYDDPETGEAIVRGGGGVFEHSYAGQKCFYAGTNLARWMLHDARSLLSYLRDRPDVDDDRIGVTGTSGGGTQTLHLSLVDDGIDVAAPCCAVTDRARQLRTGNRLHAEQVIVGSVAAGIDFDDLVAAMAPRPVCVGAAASDRYFPIEGVHDVVDRVRRVYDLYDAAERVELAVADAPHCSVYRLREEVFPWLCEHLDVGPYEPQDDLEALDPSELDVTPGGNVRGPYAEERTIDDLVRAYVAEHAPAAGTVPAPPDRDGSEVGEGVRETIGEVLGLDREGCELHPRVIERSTEDGLEVEHVWFRTEREPDAIVAGVLVSDPGSVVDESPAVVRYEEGTEALPERSDDVAALARERGTVLLFDPRGVGAVGNREVLVPNWADDYHGIFGTESKFAAEALLLGTSLLGMRVFDVCRAAEYLREATGADRISLVGEGIGAYDALYAAGVTTGVDRVDLRNLGPTFSERATRRVVPFDPQLTAFDLVRDCDVPHVLGALEERGVRVRRETGTG